MNILIIEDENAAARRLEKLVLEIEPDANIMAKIDSVESALLYLKSSPAPDLILLDWELPGLSLIADRRAALRALRSGNPHLQIIVLSGRPESIPSALAAGANGFVSKADPPERLLAALHKAQQSINMA